MTIESAEEQKNKRIKNIRDYLEKIPNPIESTPSAEQPKLDWRQELFEENNLVDINILDLSEKAFFGDVHAIWQLAYAYYDGEGVKQNFQTAEKHFRKYIDSLSKQTTNYHSNIACAMAWIVHSRSETIGIDNLPQDQLLQALYDNEVIDLMKEYVKYVSKNLDPAEWDWQLIEMFKDVFDLFSKENLD